MEVFNYDIVSKFKEFSIIFIGDVHVGNVNFNDYAFKKCIEYIEKIRKVRKVKVIGVGDYIDAIGHKDAKRFNPVEISDKYRLKDLKDLSRRQMEDFAEFLKPIKDLILFMLIGNHEEAYIKYNGFDVYDYLCKDLLNVDKKGFLALGRLVFRIINDKGDRISSKKIKLACTHGKHAGGFTGGAPLNTCIETFRAFIADVCMIAHSHKPGIKSYSKADINENGKLIKTWRWYGINPSFMEPLIPGNKSYAEGSKGEMPSIGFTELNVRRENGAWIYKLILHIWMDGRFETIGG
jgi:hypothetical protein